MYVAVVHMSGTSTGYFIICEDGNTIAEMEFHIQDNNLIVNAIRKSDNYFPNVEMKLFEAMVQYARENYLIVVSNDTWVSQSLSENSELFEDIFYQP